MTLDLHVPLPTGAGSSTRPADGLSVTGLSVSLRGTTILDGIEVHVARGETVAIVGSSGSGKSTLARTLLGLHPRHAAVRADEMRLGPDTLPPPGHRAWRALRGRRIGFVPQDPGSSLNPVYRIRTQLGGALRLAGGPADADTIAERLAEAGLAEPRIIADRYPHELSGGQRQRVLIAMGLAGRPDLVVADEPTSALDSAVAERVLDTLAEQTAGGTSLLLITHDLTVATERADRVVVLEAGCVVEEAPAADLLRTPRSTAARTLADAVPGRRRPSSVPTPEVVLTARGLHKAFGTVRALDDVHLELHHGETVAIVGESGSGKSTLARVLTGLTAPDSGEVVPAGRRTPVQLVSQNPFGALDPRWTVERIVAESLLPTSGLTRRQRRDRARETLTDVGLGEGLWRRRPGELSGGQSQRVAIARALAPHPDVVVLDEPVSALDVASQATVLDVLNALQRSYGAAYVFITHDLSVAGDIAHRALRFDAGRSSEINVAVLRRRR